jgi:hypothetical protein
MNRKTIGIFLSALVLGVCLSTFPLAQVTTVPARSGGGASLIHQATVTLTDAQIKTIDASNPYFNLVAAPGADRILLLQYGYILSDFAAAYGNVSVTDAALWFDVGGNTVADGPVNGGALAEFSAVFTAVGASRFSSYLLPVPLIPISVVATTGNAVARVNQPLRLGTYNDSGALTGGNAANQLRIVVGYLVFNYATGELE